MRLNGYSRAQDHFDYATPWDNDCGDFCREDRNQFQESLDEIATMLDGITATTMTDTLLDELRVEADCSTSWGSECDCKMGDDRNQFQDALENIAALLDGVTATTITDEILDEIRAEVAKR